MAHFRSASVVFFVIAGMLAGCSAAEDDESAVDEGKLQEMGAPLGYVGQNVVKTLTGNPKLNALRGKTWDVSAGNELKDGWLLPTTGSEWWGDKLASLPTATDCKDGEANCDPDFHMRTCDTAACPAGGGTCEAFGPTVTADGEKPKKMCVGYGDWFEEAFYDALVSANEQVDISSLWLPGDRFAPAIRNGLLRLAKRGKPVTVRILSGDVTDISYLASRSTSAALATITKGIPANAKLSIYVAEHSAAVLSWNHSKIIAVDGKFTLTGGHNMHTADYALKDPVSDLSMRLSGPAAVAAHRYSNQVWEVGCKRGSFHGFGLVSYPQGLPCPKAYEPSAEPGNGSTSMIAVGRLGAVTDNPSDDALLAMVDAAKETVVMSQEDILGGRIPKTNLSAAPPPRALIKRLAAAIGRGVDVYLVTSNVDGGLFTTSYSHGWSAAETADQMTDIMKENKDLFPEGTDIVELVCKKLHVAGIRLSDAERWADGKVFSNHAKFLMVDDQAFYIGSQNLYVSDLAEFGYIVDSPKAAREARDTFWAPLWKYSKRGAVSGSDAASCTMRK